MKKEYQAAIVERDRFQSQLEMLVQELEKSQVEELSAIEEREFLEILMFHEFIFYVSPSKLSVNFIQLLIFSAPIGFFTYD